MKWVRWIKTIFWNEETHASHRILCMMSMFVCRVGLQQTLREATRFRSMRTREVDELPRRAKEVPRPRASNGGPVVGGGRCGVLFSPVARVCTCLGRTCGRCLAPDFVCRCPRCTPESCGVLSLVCGGAKHPFIAPEGVGASTIESQPIVRCDCANMWPTLQTCCNEVAVFRMLQRTRHPTKCRGEGSDAAHPVLCTTHSMHHQ